MHPSPENHVNGPAEAPFIERVSPFSTSNDGPCRLVLGCQCRSMPVGWKVEFLAAGPDARRNVHIPQTTITNPDMSLMMRMEWPANFDTNLIIRIYRGPGQLSPVASCYPVVMFDYLERSAGGELPAGANLLGEGNVGGWSASELAPR
jgi:hypothetical protein